MPNNALALASFHSAKTEVWVRISAFLSTRSHNTQLTYAGVIREWCHFLGADAGTEKAAAALLAAKDLHAISYRSWLERRRGEVPRWMKAKARQNQSRKLQIDLHQREKKDGLQHTLSNATITKKLAVLRRVYRMLAGKGLVALNPFDTDTVAPPSKESGRKRPTEMLDFRLVKKIIAAADASSPRGLRDKAILSLFFGGGLRRGEVRNLRIGDVRTTRSGTTYLYLRATKARKDAEQAIPNWAAKVVAELVTTRIKKGASPADYLFVGYTGRGGAKETPHPISTVGIYQLFKSYCRKAGAGEFVTPHSARATAITKLLADGVPHRQVQEFSRHASVQMVELYDKRRLGVDQNPGTTLDYDEDE